MSTRDKIAQQHIDSCLIIDVAECVKADMAQAPKVCWQCGLSFADAILAIEAEGRLACTYKGQCNHRRHGLCYKHNSRDKGRMCQDERPATIADLMEVEK